VRSFLPVDEIKMGLIGKSDKETTEDIINKFKIPEAKPQSGQMWNFPSNKNTFTV
jgi:hypothetical protein